MFRLGYGIRTACSCHAKIEITDTENVVLVIAEIINAINLRISMGKELSEVFTLVPTICESRANQNTKKPYGTLIYNGRFLKDTTADYINQIISGVAEDVSKIYGGNVHTTFLTYKDSYVQNAKECVDCAIDVIEDLYGKQAVKLSSPAMFSDTFAWFTKKVPGLYVLIGSSEERLGFLHNEKVIFSNRTLQYGIGFLAEYILKMLKNEVNGFKHVS